MHVYGWPLPNSLIPVPVLDLMSTSLTALLSSKWGIVSHWTLRHKEQHRYVRTFNQPSYLTGSQPTKYKQHSLQENVTWWTTYNWFIGNIQYSLAGQFNLQHSAPCKQLTKTFRSNRLAFEYYQLCCLSSDISLTVSTQLWASTVSLAQVILQHVSPWQSYIHHQVKASQWLR